ncbi:hypothetical protein RND71_026496 [Anisodus tanguticus]|uniref:5-formyltetrahydrofolate cyclo-ligase n=1 Tax=Anisodus tanguticus TaxID=243964 RepID=A0AAE1RP10_9SOLA|nr:hypothetical protein RND71_026496 [Anisodus tanguticus]
MSTSEEQNLVAHLDTIFKREKGPPIVVKRDLKSMDPPLRSQQESDLEMRKKLYVPRMEDKNRNMRMLNISKHRGLDCKLNEHFGAGSNRYGGNDREDVLLADEPVDLLLLPRYYDTFLTRYQERAKERNWKQPLKMIFLWIALALLTRCEILDEGTISLTPNDVLVDALVSPSSLIPISPAALEICH